VVLVDACWGGGSWRGLDDADDPKFSLVCLNSRFPDGGAAFLVPSDVRFEDMT